MEEKNKKCLIYVFSGTGNTRLIADLYKQYLTDYETTIYDVKSSSITNINGKGKLYKISAFENVPSPLDYDLIGLGHPVHGFNAPKIMWDFSKFLPKVNEKEVCKIKTFIFTTSGEGLSPNDFATQKIARSLKRKGYEFVQQRRYVMPYNMMFRHSPEMVKSEWIYAQKLAEYSCQKLLRNEKEKVLFYHPGSFFLPLLRILWIYAKVQSPFMKVDMNKCIKCQKCVKACPYGNISYNAETSKFSFGTNCVLCVACSFGCPACAISIGLLNKWRVNGDYKIQQTAKNEALQFPYFTKENLKGLKKWAYLKYYKKLDDMLSE